MTTAQLSTLVQRLEHRVPPDAGASDAELLGRFLADRDEAAFALIVRRHGPTVFGVCRRVTGDHHLAEDAFQAVFVVLAAKAGAVRPRSALSAWLYGVAYRTALRARTTADRRREHERASGGRQPPEWIAKTRGADAPRSPEHAESSAILDEEIARLPERLRVAVVLCELEGQSRKDAAARLGVPEGTLSSRLAAARKALVPENATVFWACWPPDGKKIAYTWRQRHADVVKKLAGKQVADPADVAVQTEAFLVVADADGSNARTIASGKTDNALDIPLLAIDWR